MLNDVTGADHIFIKCGYTDLRRGIYGLAAQVKQEMELNPSEWVWLHFARVWQKSCTPVAKSQCR